LHAQLRPFVRPHLAGCSYPGLYILLGNIDSFTSTWLIESWHVQVQSFVDVGGDVCSTQPTRILMTTAVRDCVYCIHDAARGIVCGQFGERRRGPGRAGGSGRADHRCHRPGAPRDRNGDEGMGSSRVIYRRNDLKTAP
jgi:hypothetical protein